MPVAAAPKLSDSELVEMLSLMKGADSVELKLTIPESSQRSTLEALGMDPLGAQVRLVHFYDTPDLTLESQGVVVRARRVAQKGDDSAAVSFAREAIRVGGESADRYVLLAHSLERLGKHDDAQDATLKALELDPSRFKVEDQ